MTRRSFVHARFGSVVVSGALAAGLLASLPVTGHAATSTVAVTHPCVGSFYLLGNNKIDTVPGSGPTPQDIVTVDQPASVGPGEVYQVTVAPGQMRTGGVPAGRLGYELALPASASLVRAEIAGPGENVSGTGQVQQIAADGSAAADGRFLRVWGGGGYVAPGQAVTGDNSWQNGFTVAANTTFRLPAVTLTLRASVTAGGRSIPVGYRGSGTGGSSSSRENALVGMEEAGAAGLANDVFYCGASANASTLANTPVDGSRPVYQARTATALNTPDSTVITGQSSLALSATVSSQDESVSRVRTGSMSFTVTDADTGATVATVPAGAIDGTGTAGASYTFPALAAGELTHRYLVRANYSGLGGDIEASSSGTASTVTVAYREHTADMELTSVNGQLTNGALPVTVSGKVVFTDRSGVPAGTRVELLRDGTVIGTPVTVATNGTFAFPADNAPRRETTEVAVVVVRWFGGTKLGTGGLARAYSAATAEAIRAARQRGRVLQVHSSPAWACEVSHTQAGGLESELRSAGVEVLSIEYGRAARIRVAGPREVVAPILAARTSGGVEWTEDGKAVHERPVRS